MGRVILHCDANSFYASCEICYNPSLRDKPVAVGGDEEARHGIVLTANPIAKKEFGVKTGEAIWQAKQKCPNLIVRAADYPLYLHMSRLMRRIEEEYSDRVEAFGLDENWIDVSSPRATVEGGERIANEIRGRIKAELGITISVGVADNKIWAKLGSDMKKPDAVTVIRREKRQDTIWRLPASDLLYVGPASARKLANIGVTTIGALAGCDDAVLVALLGKNGLMLKRLASGGDESPVMPVGTDMAIKSIGNSTTTPRDMETMDDVRCVLYMLAECVATRLREHGFRGRCVSLGVRDTFLACNSCQATLPPTSLTAEIAEAALGLFTQRFVARLPLRSIGIHVGNLEPDTLPVQMDLFGVNARRMRTESLERSVDLLRGRFGHQVVQRGIVYYDAKFRDINPHDEHTIHPVSFFAG